MINRAFSVQLFLVLGYFIKKYERNLYGLNTIYLLAGCGIYVLVGLMSILLFPEQNLDVHKGGYYNIPICAIMVIFGCVLLFGFAKRFDFNNRGLCFIGRNTLVYYMLASYPITAYYAVTLKLGINVSNVYLSAMAKAFFVCGLCAVFSLISVC